MIDDGRIFKAKRLDNGEWVEGFYQARKDIFEKDEHLIFRGESYYTWEYAKIDPSTLCQYTGLTDKNGEKIWENDVVLVTDDQGSSGQVDTGVGEINVLCGLWYIGGRVQNSLYDINDCFQIEVIGNIFDHPELLRGE